MYWIYDVPNWLFGALTIGVFLLVGLGGYYATRQWVRSLHHGEHDHNDVVGFYLGSLTVFYGITLGLLMVGVWTNFSDTDAKVSREAATVAAIYRDAGNYPEPTRSQLEEELRNYCYNVINVVWPDQRKGIVSKSSVPILNRLQKRLAGFEPATEGQKILHAEAFRQFNQLIEQRRMRLNDVATGLSPSLWVLVLFGAFLNIGATWFFHLKNPKMHFWMTILISSLLGLMIFLLAAMDHPFRGELSVGPDAFQAVYDQMHDDLTSGVH